MRLKSFSAPTMALAMSEVRKVLGADAIIVSTRTDERTGSTTVMAAMEGPARNAPLEQNFADTREHALDSLDAILAFHRVPPEIADTLRATAHSLSRNTASALMAGTLDMHFRFCPPIPAAGGTIVLMGPPGAGKTVAAAKIAAMSLLGGRPARLVNADTVRPGGGARLQALADRLGVPIEDAPRDRMPEQDPVLPPHGVRIVDAPGINPFDEADTHDLRQLLVDADATRLLVLPAGCDAMEAVDHALAFSTLGADALIASRMDAALRYGSVLAAAHAAGLPFCGAAIQPQIGDGLTVLNPTSLAHLLTMRWSNGNTFSDDQEFAA